MVKGKWVFGGYERGSKNVFVEAAEDRKVNTLLKVINDWIEPETTIISDFWKVYDCLKEEGFQHLTVNHTYSFVDPETSI